MANKIIQLSDGSDELHPKEYVSIEEYTSSINTTYFPVHNVYVYRIGQLGIVYINLQTSSSCPRGSEVTLFTMDSKYRPNGKYNFSVAPQGSGNGCLIQIYSGGNVTFYKDGTDNSFHRSTLVFPLD